ncbi:MAG: alpha/beta family hydrolase [Chromatiaceae bacterium]|jgi:predicted alpha/beta-hydrolase family hydrolase
MTILVYPAATQPTLARLLLLHGAGASVQSAFFQQLIPLLTAAGIEVHAANFAYMAKTMAGLRQVAPKAEKLVAELDAMIQTLSQAENGAALAAEQVPLWLAGKSLGGRVVSLYLAGSEVASQVAGGLVFGYPLCPPAKAKDPVKAAQVTFLRSRFLQQLKRPLLICQGSRDAFGAAAELQKAGVGKAGSDSSPDFIPATVLELALADHDFTLPKSRARQAAIAPDAAFVQAATAAAEFIRNQHAVQVPITTKE